MLQWALLHSVASACSQTPFAGTMTARQSMLRHLQTVHTDSDAESHENLLRQSTAVDG